MYSFRIPTSVVTLGMIPEASTASHHQRLSAALFVDCLEIDEEVPDNRMTDKIISSAPMIFTPVRVSPMRIAATTSVTIGSKFNIKDVGVLPILRILGIEGGYLRQTEHQRHSSSSIQAPLGPVQNSVVPPAPTLAKTVTQRGMPADLCATERGNGCMLNAALRNNNGNSHRNSREQCQDNTGYVEFVHRAIRPHCHRNSCQCNKRRDENGCPSLNLTGQQIIERHKNREGKK